MRTEDNKRGGELSFEEVKRIAHIDESNLALQNRHRPGYSIRAFLCTGNNCGEKRVFQALDQVINDENAEKYILAMEGYAGATLFKNMENYAAITNDNNYKTLFNIVKKSGKGWDVSEEGGLKGVIMMLGFMYQMREEPSYSEVVSAIDDREEKGMRPGEQMNKIIADKGMCAFEAYTVYNKKILFYGLENQELLKIQSKLSHGEADEHFYKVAKIRSRVMFNNLIDLMDKEKKEKALVHMTGFHHMVFKELAKANGIEYEAEFVHKLPSFKPLQSKNQADQ